MGDVTRRRALLTANSVVISFEIELPPEASTTTTEKITAVQSTIEAATTGTSFATALAAAVVTLSYDTSAGIDTNGVSLDSVETVATFAPSVEPTVAPRWRPIRSFRGARALHPAWAC